MQNLHLIAHKVEVICANLARNLEVFNLRRVLAIGLDDSLQRTSLVEVSDIILASLATVRIGVSNPRGYLRACQHKLILASSHLAVDSDGELMRLTRLVGEDIVTLETIGDAIDSEREECIQSLDTLRYNNSTHSAIRRWHHKDALLLGLAHGCNLASGKVYRSLACGVRHHSRLRKQRKLALGKACTLLEDNIGTSHTVVEGHPHTLLARCDVLNLAPQEIRCSITTIVGLVLLNLELVGRDTLWMSIGVVTIKVDVGLGILVVYRARR